MKFPLSIFFCSLYFVIDDFFFTPTHKGLLVLLSGVLQRERDLQFLG